MPHGSDGSFRDPGGFIFSVDGELYRQVNASCREHYALLMNSGLYAELRDAGLLISHTEAPLSLARTADAIAVLRPERVPFISYPYEWCFSALQDAALCTLEIQKRALARGLSLKDASAYNIQFVRGKPLLIDTLSFETYAEGLPWVAYRQFCQHFLAPLALMSFKDVRLNTLLRSYIDGVPLDLAAALLPFSACLQPGIFFHIYLHAKSQIHFADKPRAPKDSRVSLNGMRGLLDNLTAVVAALRPAAFKSEWGEYYRCTHYSALQREEKARMVDLYIDRSAPKMVWDLAGNTGFFGRIAARRGIPAVSFDIDHTAVEKGYAENKMSGEKNLLPLLLDLTNPTPGIGWENRERMSLAARGPADTVLALALIHHLSIGNNVPFDKLAEFFAGMGKYLVIEFVPKSDPMAQRLLASREDIFPRYTPADFTAAFSRRFSIEHAASLSDSGRTLFLMRALPRECRR
jgi:hypothetical protein